MRYGETVKAIICHFQQILEIKKYLIFISFPLQHSCNCCRLVTQSSNIYIHIIHIYTVYIKCSKTNELYIVSNASWFTKYFAVLKRAMFYEIFLHWASMCSYHFFILGIHFPSCTFLDYVRLHSFIQAFIHIIVYPFILLIHQISRSPFRGHLFI